MVDRRRFGHHARRAGRIAFRQYDAADAVGYLGAALGSFAVAMTVATFFILIVARLLPFSIANIVIAFSPGAQDTMMVLALALHLDPVYVGAHHLARFLVVTISVGVAARRGRAPRKDAPEWDSTRESCCAMATSSGLVYSAASARSLSGRPQPLPDVDRALRRACRSAASS